MNLRNGIFYGSIVAAIGAFTYKLKGQFSSSSSSSSLPSPSSSSVAEEGSTPSAAELLDFAHVVGQLKSTVRTGWVDRKVDHAESVCDHSYRMAMMSLAISQAKGYNLPTLNTGKCIKIALVHDLAEAIVGDITPEHRSGIPKSAKAKMELAAMHKIIDTLGASSNTLGAEIMQLFLEYEHQTTNEAKLIKDIDKLEMIIQAFEYEKQQNKKLQGFFDTVEGKVRHPVVKSMEAVLRQRRNNYQNTSIL